MVLIGLSSLGVDLHTSARAFPNNAAFVSVDYSQSVCRVSWPMPGEQRISDMLNSIV
jgi:hypothetical protein